MGSLHVIKQAPTCVTLSDGRKIKWKRADRGHDEKWWIDIDGECVRGLGSPDLGEVLAFAGVSEDEARVAMIRAGGLSGEEAR